MGIRVRIRMDYRSTVRSGRSLFGSKNIEKAAEEQREQQAAFYRNVPVQGVTVEHIDMSQEVYTVQDEVNGKEIAYAPLSLNLLVASWEDVVKFVAREEFRTIEIVEPAQIMLNATDVEKLMYNVSLELQKYRENLERKLNYR